MVRVKHSGVIGFGGETFKPNSKGIVELPDTVYEAISKTHYPQPKGPPKPLNLEVVTDKSAEQKGS